jgi:RNA polymerase sigma-70 factor (ECF subfamily)
VGAEEIVPSPSDIRGTAPGGEEDRSSDRVDTFVRLLGQNQRRIFVFVMSMVPNLSDAEEIVQETNLVLWREFDAFRPGTNFAAWACRVALNQTLAWRKRRRRDRLEFSPAFLEAVASESTAEADRLEERSQALGRCIEKLPDRHRWLLRSRYGGGRGVVAIGQELGRSAEAVYRSLSRIRHTLHDCVTHALAQGDRP